jgi:hypothetical protein
MNLIHLEDDPLYADYIRLELEDLAKADPPSLVVRRVSTERQFLKEKLSILTWGNAFLLDVMVRWSFPEDESDPSGPKDPEGLYYDAGLRCARFLLKNLPQSQPRIILLYTVYDRPEIQTELADLQKSRGHHTLRMLTKEDNMEEVWKILKGK